MITQKKSGTVSYSDTIDILYFADRLTGMSSLISFKPKANTPYKVFTNDNISYRFIDSKRIEFNIEDLKAQNIIK